MTKTIFPLLAILLLMACEKESVAELLDEQNVDLIAQDQAWAENLTLNNLGWGYRAYFVFKANQPIVIDGLEDDWGNVPRRKLQMELDLGSPIESKLDLSSYFKILWDDDYLYVFVSVTDEEINLNGAEVYEKDGVEFYFDGDNSKNVAPGPPTSFPPPAYDSNDDFFRFLPYGTGALGAYGIISTANFESEIMITDKGYDVEIKMPFSDLPELSAEVGSKFGFEFQVNDNDNDQRQNSLKWSSSLDNSFFDPSTFATAILINKRGRGNGYPRGNFPERE